MPPLALTWKLPLLYRGNLPVQCLIKICLSQIEVQFILHVSHLFPCLFEDSCPHTARFKKPMLKKCSFDPFRKMHLTQNWTEGFTRHCSHRMQDEKLHPLTSTFPPNHCLFSNEKSKTPEKGKIARSSIPPIVPTWKFEK